MTVIDRFGRPKEVPASYVVQEGESVYVPFGEMHLPTHIRRMGDAAFASLLQDGITDAVPPGFFRDGYGRLLVSGTTSGDDRADGKALAARLLYEQDLQDAHKASDAEPAYASVNAGSFTKKGMPYGEVPEVRAAREQYERDIANAWRETDPAPPARTVAYGGGKRREA